MRPHPRPTPGSAQIGTCHHSGKRQYGDRATARRAARHLYPHTALRAYQCGTCRYWHIGNTAPWRKKGDNR